jgi:hypothetical protein
VVFLHIIWQLREKTVVVESGGHGEEGCGLCYKNLFFIFVKRVGDTRHDGRFRISKEILDL